MESARGFHALFVQIDNIAGTWEVSLCILHWHKLIFLHGALCLYFWFKYDIDRSTMHHKFDLTWVQTHGVSDHDSAFHVPEMLILTTEPSGTLIYQCQCQRSCTKDITILIQVRLRTKVLSTPSSTRLGFEFMTSRSWQHFSCQWDACSNHAIPKTFRNETTLHQLIDDTVTGFIWHSCNQAFCVGVGQHIHNGLVQINLPRWYSLSFATS